VTIYKDLSEVERAVANLKDVIEMRPVYHQTDGRVQAHLFVAALAFLLHRAIEKKLKAARLDLSATEALHLLRSVRVVDFTIGASTTKRSVTRGSTRAAQVLAAWASLTSIPRPHRVEPRHAAGARPAAQARPRPQVPN
jgi:transposase